MNLIVVFNSGQSNELRLTDSSNIDYVEVFNSNEQYFKEARIRVYDLDYSKLTVNSLVHIFIDGSLEFVGYISRIQKNLAGVIYLDIQCIGKTYDLWRFIIPQDTVYTSSFSCYIVSSLVANYCSGHRIFIDPPDVSKYDGNYIEYIDVSMMTVGDAIARISKFDGYHFHVDNNNKLHYYKVSDDVQFTINAEDILSLRPIEFSDETIKNKAIVIGSRAYEYIMPSKKPQFISGSWIFISTQNTLVSQPFGLPTLTRDVLSYVSVRASIGGSSIPNYLKARIQTNNLGIPDELVQSSDTIVWYGPSVSPLPSGIYLDRYIFPNGLPLDPSTDYHLVFYAPNATPNAYWKIGYVDKVDDVYNFTSNMPMIKYWDYNDIDYGDVYIDGERKRVVFKAKTRGYAASNTWNEDISLRKVYIGLRNPIFSDEVDFVISSQILSYGCSGDVGEYKRTDDGRFRPRLSIGLIDYSSVFKPMFGIEFDL